MGTELRESVVSRKKVEVIHGKMVETFKSTMGRPPSAKEAEKLRNQVITEANKLNRR